jgi:MOSC domain-containing protein YiiM
VRVLSVNVGLPHEVVWRGKLVTTGIYKEPVAGHVPLRRLNLEGDRQADLRVHGGPEKAVYAYPAEFYEFWSHERPELDFGPGTFGENLTTEGLLDGDVSIGDRFRVGTAELVVTQPRLPCFKLGIKMERDEFVLEFLERGLLGFYFAVAREGDVAAGDAIIELERRLPAPGDRPHPRAQRELPVLRARSAASTSGTSPPAPPSPWATSSGRTASFGLLAIRVLSTEKTESHRLQPLDAIQKPDV